MEILAIHFSVESPTREKCVVPMVDFHSKKVEKLLNKSLFANQIKPVLLYSRICGASPLQETFKGYETNFFSTYMLYSLWFYVTFVMSIVLVSMESIRVYENLNDFCEKLYIQILLVLMMPYVMLPFTGWQDVKYIVKYLNTWTQFQIFYHDVTNNILDLKIKNTIVFLTAFVLGESAMSVVGLMFTPPYIKPWQAPTVFVGFVLHASIVAVWVVACTALSHAATDIAKRFKTDIENCRSARKVYEYRCLWLHLSDLTSHTGDICYRAYGLYAFVTVCTVTSSLYGCVTKLRTGHFGIAMTLFALAAVSAIPFLLVCEEAHVSSNQVKNCILQEIDKVRTSNERFKTVTDEIDAFQTIIELNAPAISFGGFLIVDRQLMFCVGAAVMTYIIVLAQFQMSDKREII